MRQSRTLYIGMDVHKESIAVAYVAQAHAAEVIYLGTLGTRQCDIDHLSRKMPSKAPYLVFVDEAGPCGDGRSRDPPTRGPGCGVVAPALLPQQAGERVKTDRQDAVHLARLRRSGDLPPVDVPTVADDAIRDLSRAREAAIRARQAAKGRRNAVWLRHDRRATGHATWGPAHLRWLADVVCATPAHQRGFQEAGRAGTEHPARLPRREHARHAPVNSWRLPPGVAALAGLRGVQCPGAVTRVAARGDLPRVEPPRHVMHALGLLPSADSRDP
jgi:transposase